MWGRMLLGAAAVFAVVWLFADAGTVPVTAPATASVSTADSSTGPSPTLAAGSLVETPARDLALTPARDLVAAAKVADPPGSLGADSEDSPPPPPQRSVLVVDESGQPVAGAVVGGTMRACPTRVCSPRDRSS